jgi:SAM-dependent methyltransferase
MAAALREAARVLRPGGTVYVQEPLAHGPMFELLRLVDDETAVRALAQRALATVAPHTLELVARRRLDVHEPTPDIEALRDRVVLADPRRAASLDAVEPELRDRFERLAETDPATGTRGLRQPLQVHLLRRPARA